VRDLFGLGVDSTVFSVWTYMKPNWLSYAAAGTNLIIARAQLLSSDQLIYEALDPYVFVRDVYLQRIKIRIEKVRHPDQE
jgi:ABC-type transporter lipoprotein component MlaA